MLYDIIIPYKCKICGQGDIEYPHDICSICGWEDDSVQNNDTNYYGGANILTFNQYKLAWEKYKDEINKTEIRRSDFIEQLLLKDIKLNNLLNDEQKNV